MSVATKLALLGGPKAVTIEDPEQWQPPYEREIELCTQVIRERSFSNTNASVCVEFERRFKEFVGTEFCLAQNNGTSTILAAYFAVGVGPGDEVITPSYGWVCTFGPAMMLGAHPVFCDIDPNTLLADPEDIERRITSRTKAICVPHLFGNVCDMDRILAVGRKHDIPVIEDCSHSHGARWDGKPIGSLGDVGCFSMQGGTPGGKPIAGGEAGVVVTNNRRYYERILVMGHLNRVGFADEITDPDYRLLAPTGFAFVKFRPNSLSLAIGLASIETVAYRSQRIWENYLHIEAGLKDVPAVRLVSRYPKAQPGGFYGNFRGLYDPEALGGLTVEKFIQAVNAEGASLGGRAYSPYHLHPLFAQGMPFYDDGRGPLTGDYKGYERGDLPVTESAMSRIIAFPALIDPKPGYVVQYVAAIQKVAENYRQLL
jgi:dTDP-4-amino-4,6-dideoxygalactose transaminase